VVAQVLVRIAMSCLTASRSTARLMNSSLHT
jgi:hypothetical protein